jgi:hypothetical protein
MATQRDASSALRCHAGDSGAACLVGRASLRAGPTPYNSPGGDGGEAEGRMPFAALSADARGGLKARSAFRQWTPSAYHPTLHQARAGALPLPAQCLLLTLAHALADCPTPAAEATVPGSGPTPTRQRSTRRQRRELLQGHPERRCLASLSLRARASRRRQGHRLARRGGAAWRTFFLNCLEQLDLSRPNHQIGTEIDSGTDQGRLKVSRLFMPLQRITSYLHQRVFPQNLSYLALTP